MNEYKNEYKNEWNKRDNNLSSGGTRVVSCGVAMTCSEIPFFMTKKIRSTPVPLQDKRETSLLEFIDLVTANEDKDIDV